MVSNGTTTPGVLIAFLLYLDQFFSPVQQLSQVFDSYQQARIALTRIDGLLRTPTSTPEPASPAALPDGRVRGALTFDSVHFRYGPNAGEAIDGVELEIAAGQTVAFVGHTGAGKSTLVKLVARFYDPTSGSVRVDGVDLRDLDLAGYRHHLGIVPQEPFLFSGTIRDNIAYGRPAASDAEVEAAARAAGAHDLVASLRGGYLHPVSERGRSLSAGQRQLVALARARLVDPAILLLDEATSQLDLAAEARVTQAMNAVAANRTTLLIAHRLPTARHADRIIVMGDGHVLETGTHEQLIGREGPYAAAWAAFDDDAPVAGD
jgi:ATP-binding cassette subfamily B protein